MNAQDHLSDISDGRASGRRAIRQVDACRWSVVVVAAREDIATLSSVIEAVTVALRGHSAVIDVMINGNRNLSQGIASYLESNAGPRLASLTFRVWDLSLRDKAHAWNEYVHRIWPGSELAFFIDGYVKVLPDAFTHMDAAIAAAKDALAVTAVPAKQGVERDTLARSGGFQGNLHALRGHAMAELRGRGIRLPLSLYWVDGLVSAILSFRFDPARHRWDSTSIAVSLDASWVPPDRSVRSVNDVKGQLKRMTRQARGRFENRGVEQHLAVERRPPETLPLTARDLVVGWVRRHPFGALRMVARYPLSIGILWPFGQRQDGSLKDVPPVLVAVVSALRHDTSPPCRAPGS